eukprot:TRINITY_DN3449_c0_g1_i5.p1 TRINITY_DN3449_c0_g1~~TRINITY_DN3449_c0_g1_i5.p1  ORF type:complete len:399 (-),score=40.69 TRINITY_DN3449_c0_g1_i5:231-1388(-)
MSSLAYTEQVLSQEETTLETSQRSCFGLPLRLAKSASLLAVGVATGIGCFSVSKQGRFRAPVTPLARTALQRLTKLPAELPKFPVAFPIPPNNECGAAICAEGDLCCPGGPGYGYSCGTSQAVCCQGFLFNDDGSPSQVSVAIVCGENDVCCKNGDGNPYCCASGNQCTNNVCVAGGGQCFPGDSTLQVLGKGAVPLASTNDGNRVLVKDSFGDLQYQPILSFLHQTHTELAQYVTVVHERGDVRMSDSHIASVVDTSGLQQYKHAAQLAPGDVVQISGPVDGASNLSLSTIISVRRSTGASGMFAPMTWSGHVIVDGVVASCYARPFLGFSVQHGAMHAAMFFMRNLKVYAADVLLPSRFPLEVEVGAVLAAVSIFLMSAKKSL